MGMSKKDAAVDFRIRAGIKSGSGQLVPKNCYRRTGHVRSW